MNLVNELRPRVLQTINDFGSDAILRSEATFDYDPAEGIGTKTDSEKSIKVIVEAYTAMEMIGDVLSGDLKVMIPNVDVVPTIKDKIIFNGLIYNIINIEPSILQNEVLYYQLQVRV